ncbi:MAG: c-type cytochrome [Verrucomicrobiales bacterium]
MPVLRSFFLSVLLLVLLVVGWAGFRGDTTTKPPLYVFPDMDDQAKVKFQAESTFFANGKGAQKPVAGTVPMGLAVATQSSTAAPGAGGLSFSVGTDYFHTGRFGDYWGDGMPAEVTLDPALIRRGAERYGIYCAVCHGHTGAGDGITSKYGVPMATGNFHLPPFTDKKDPTYRSDGNIFATITYGKGQMGPYGAMIPVADRWAIIAYIRTLHVAKAATASATAAATPPTPPAVAPAPAAGPAATTPPAPAAEDKK